LPLASASDLEIISHIYLLHFQAHNQGLGNQEIAPSEIKKQKQFESTKNFLVVR